MPILTNCAKWHTFGSMSKRKRRVDLAEQFRTAFTDSGLSRFKLARRAGVSYATVYRFMSGERSVTLDTASKLAEVLGLEMRPSKKE